MIQFGFGSAYCLLNVFMFVCSVCSTRAHTNSQCVIGVVSDQHHRSNRVTLLQCKTRTMYNFRVTRMTVLIVVDRNTKNFSRSRAKVFVVSMRTYETRSREVNVAAHYVMCVATEDDFR